MANLDINVFSNQGGEKLMPGFLGLGKSGRPEAESQSGSSESELDSLRQLFLERNIKSIDELETRLTPILKLTCSDFKLEPEVRKQAAGIWAYKINKLIPNFQLSADVFDEAEALILEAALRHNDKAEARGFFIKNEIPSLDAIRMVMTFEKLRELWSQPIGDEPQVSGQEPPLYTRFLLNQRKGGAEE